MGHLLSREGPILSSGERQAIIRRVVDEALGLGILEPLLADPSVTEIMVNGHETIFVERAGVLQRLDAHFASEDQLLQTIDRIVAASTAASTSPARWSTPGSPPASASTSSCRRSSLDGPMLTIRRFPRAYTLAELVDKGALDDPTALLLGALVRARCNVIVSGGTGTGKTTMLNALSGFIPDHERIITIEDAAELQLQQEHVIRLESRPPNIEGKGQVTIRDLVRNSLRMRPDRIIVGEVRGGETLDMLQAMNTGHEGSLATVHANSSDDALMRLETLASMSEIKIPFEALRDQINSAVDVVVQLSRGADGTRRVTEIAAVASRRREDFALATIVRFDAGRWRPTAWCAAASPTTRCPAARRAARAGRRAAARVVPRGPRPARADDPAGQLMRPAAALSLLALSLLVAVLGAWSLARGAAENRALIGDSGRYGRVGVRGLLAGSPTARCGAPAGAARWRTGWPAPGSARCCRPRRSRSPPPRSSSRRRSPRSWSRSTSRCCSAWPRCGVCGRACRGARSASARPSSRRCPSSRGCCRTPPAPGCRSAPRSRWPARSSPSRPAPSCSAARAPCGRHLAGGRAEQMEQRLPGRELGVLVGTLVISSRSGGSLISALRDIAGTLEDRKELKREVRTLLTQATYTGYLVVAMGIGLLFLLNAMHPGLLQDRHQRPHRPGRARLRRAVLLRGPAADPADDEDRVVTGLLGNPVLMALLAAGCAWVACAATPGCAATRSTGWSSRTSRSCAAASSSSAPAARSGRWAAGSRPCSPTPSAPSGSSARAAASSRPATPTA